MRKIIKLTESDLTRIIKRVLSESKRLIAEEMVKWYESDYDLQKNILKVYSEIISAVTGPGTDPDRLYKAISNLDCYGFFDLLRLFPDKKTGYSSFDEMINKEYEIDNYDDVLKIANFLNGLKTGYDEKAYNVTFSSSNLPLIGKVFKGNFKIDFSKVEKDYEYERRKEYSIKTKTIIVDYQIIIRHQNLINKAKDYLKKYISNPAFKAKFKKNWMSTDDFVEYWMKKYMDYLNTPIKPVFHDKPKNVKLSKDEEENINTAHAWVERDYPNQIVFNLNTAKDHNDDKLFNTIVHELQHQLYYIKPFAPETKVNDIFKTSHEELNPFSTKINPSSVDNTYVRQNYELKYKKGEPFLNKTENKHLIDPSKIYNTNDWKNLKDEELLDKEWSYYSKRESKRKSIANDIYRRRIFPKKSYDEVYAIIDHIDWWGIKNAKDDYPCDESENLSRLMAIKQELKLNSAQNLTTKDLDSLIKVTKEGDNFYVDILQDNLYWLLSCWAKQGYLDLDSWLLNINSIVKNKNQLNINKPIYT
jgi:hypothetical protein